VKEQGVPETSPAVEPKTPETGTRLVGYDLARCIAFFGMVVVNYQILMGGFSGGPEWLYQVFKACSGRAAATFVILAGVGLTLMYRARGRAPVQLSSFRMFMSPLRPIILILLLGTSWIAVDFYVQERSLGRSFNFGPVSTRRTPPPRTNTNATASAAEAAATATPKRTPPPAPVGERFTDHMGSIKAGNYSTFLKIGMGFCGTLLLLFWIFTKKFKSPHGVLVKRALFLFAFGYMWWPLWSFDILHFYGFYLLAGCIFLALKSRWIWLAWIGVMGGAFYRQFAYDATEVREWRTSAWEGWEGAFKNLFINGIHPVLPWFGFLLTGMLIGRLNTSKARTRFGLLFVGIALATFGHMSSEPLEHWLYPEKYETHGNDDQELVIKEPERQANRRNNNASRFGGFGGDSGEDSPQATTTSNNNNRNRTDSSNTRAGRRGNRPGGRRPRTDDSQSPDAGNPSGSTPGNPENSDAPATPNTHSDGEATPNNAATPSTPETGGPTSNTNQSSPGNRNGRGNRRSRQAKPLPMTVAEGFPKDKHAEFMKDVEKVRTRLARQGSYADRKIRVEEVEFAGKTRPAVILEVSYGKDKPAPPSHKRGLDRVVSSIRRSIIYDQERFDAEKERWETRREETRERRRRRAVAEGRDPDDIPENMEPVDRATDSEAQENAENTPVNAGTNSGISEVAEGATTPNENNPPANEAAANTANNETTSPEATGNATPSTSTSNSSTTTPPANNGSATPPGNSGGRQNSRNRFRGEVWPIKVDLVGIERHMLVKKDEAQELVLWDTSWVEVEAVRKPTAKQRLSSMTTVSSNSKSPYYMLTAIGTSMTVIGLCLILGTITRLRRIITPFVLTGQMALTLYIGHAVVGFYILNWIDMRRGNQLPFIAFYVIMCWVTSVAFSVAWRAFFKRGPLEIFMRWMTS
jgi:uncharacterized membrane protein YeiB